MKSDTRSLIGWAIVVIGAISLIDNLFGDAHFWNLIWKLWPLILVVLGVYIIRNQNRFRRNTDSDNLSSETRLFGDLDISLGGMDTGDHRFSTLIGDIKIDLSEVNFDPGEKEIEATVLIGDTRILVPERVSVKLSSQCLLGDIKFDDLKRKGFFQKLDRADGGYETADKKLLLNVSSLIGDLEVLRVKTDDVN